MGSPPAPFGPESRDGAVPRPEPDAVAPRRLYSDGVRSGVWETMLAVLLMAALGGLFRLVFELVMR